MNTFIMIKGIIHQKDITLINIYTLNLGATKYIKQVLTEPKGSNLQKCNLIKGPRCPTDIYR